jgi:AcrR family transcriptional regulator
MARATKPSRLKCANQATTKGVVIASAAKDSHLIEMKQQQIVDSASKIFFEKGFHPTTIRMIAKASGMSMGQLYHYISSKDDVLYLVHENVYQGLREHLVNSENIKDPVEKLIVALRHTLEFITENRKLVQFAYSESKYLRKKHLRAVLEMYTQNTICFWRQLLDELNRKKRLKLDLDFAASLIAHQTGFLALSGWTLKDKPLNESINLLIEFILRGLGLSINH